VSENAEQPDDQRSIDLRDPALAAFLAWLIPGLGHLYQRRIAKAALFFVCIMGTFTYGLYLGSSNESTPDGRKIGWGRVVYFSWVENHKRLHYLCQVGVGLPSMPALWQAMRVSKGKQPAWDGFMAPPKIASQEGGAKRRDATTKQPTEDELHKTLHHFFEMGTVYTMIAGLLNVLAIYDAWGGPVWTETAKKEDEEEEAEKGKEAVPETDKEQPQ